MADITKIGGVHYEMMRRCYDEKSVLYKSYGAKGIKVCPEWHDKAVFKAWCLENGWCSDLRLNRKDATKDYTPENCYFGTLNKKIGNGKVREYKKGVAERKKKWSDIGVAKPLDKDEFYKTYVGMHNRCENKNQEGYKYYGARGIKVCEEWSGKDGFYNFRKWCNEHPRVEGYTLDRIDVNGDYSPENCKWSSSIEQSINKRNVFVVNYGGYDMPISVVARLEGIDSSTIKRNYLKYGNLETALIKIKSRKPYKSKNQKNKI